MIKCLVSEKANRAILVQMQEHAYFNEGEVNIVQLTDNENEIVLIA